MRHSSIYEGTITSVYEFDLPVIYFEKSIKVGVLERPSSYQLLMENPAFYEILAKLTEAIIVEKKVRLYTNGGFTQFIDGINFSEEERKNKVADACLYIYQNEIDFIKIYWKDYPNIDEVQRSKFWKRLLRTRMQRLDFLGYNPYHMFHPNVYNFWQQQEPNIDFYLREFIRLRNLDQHQVETNLGRKL